ncbi:MAG: hypothetical protein ACLUZZ_00825 [Alistipes inops]
MRVELSNNFEQNEGKFIGSDGVIIDHRQASAPTQRVGDSSKESISQGEKFIAVYFRRNRGRGGLHQS